MAFVLKDDDSDTVQVRDSCVGQEVNIVAVLV